jgi:hypothetical protein
MRRRLSFEQFEPRELLAVTTSIDNTTGTLTVTGDAGADSIAIFGTANAGEFTIQGRGGTTVNGAASATIGGVTGDLVIQTGNGNDTVNLDHVYLAGSLWVQTDDGDDVVVFGATGVVSARVGCDVLSMGGNDLFRAEAYKAFFGGFLTVHDYGDGAAFLNGASAHSVRVNLVPQVFLQNVTSQWDLIVETQSPVNSIAIINTSATNLRVDLPSGQNSVYIDTCSAHGILVEAFSLWGGSGASHPVVPDYNIDDTVTVARCQTPVITINTAGSPAFKRLHLGGNDTIYVYGNHVVGPVAPNAPVVAVDTGDGNDTVAASYNVTLAGISVMLEDLDDTLNLIGNQITGAMVADGGTGTNRLFLLGNQFTASSFSFFQ